MIKLKISSRCHHPKHLHYTIKITSKSFMNKNDLDYSIAIYKEKDNATYEIYTIFGINYIGVFTMTGYFISLSENLNHHILV